ncbi:PAS domain S-box protein [Mesorhizobium sp. B2-3-3]|nr:PAS domain S-box protein [Mesorhizobium sp. B2-3-3]
MISFGAKLCSSDNRKALPGRIIISAAGLGMQQGRSNRAARHIGERGQPDSDIAREQSALYRLTDRLYHATGLIEVYEAALDAICEILGCSRASILRFDSQGIMCFVASRSLSEQYKGAVEGHSPWAAGQRDVEPIFVEDIRHSGEPQHLVETILGEGIEALAFIPLVSARELIGKFMVYYPLPHHFTTGECELALTIARQLGFAIERDHSDAIARRLSLLVESSDDAIIAMEPTGIITDWNSSAGRLFGYNRDEMIGRSVMLLSPPDLQHEEPEILARVRAGDHVEHYETIRLRKDGSTLPVSLTVSPIADASGAIVGISKIARDTSERLRAQQQQQMLLREMDHRVKNLFAITSSIVNLSASAAETPAALASIVSDRLGALARAHALTMRASEGRSESAATSLHALLAAILAPYHDDANEHPRWAINGVDMSVPSTLITPLSLLLHEFATNAAKYGGLSTAEGSVKIACSNRDGKMVMQWREAGGPPPSKTPREGFGGRLIRLAASQLGRVDIAWESTGAVIELTIDREIPA